MSVRVPSLAGVLNAFKAQIFADLKVSCPAKVESFDAATQTVDVAPQIKDFYENEEGERIAVAIPIIRAVPLVFPGSGGMRITFPISRGDTVLLVFSDRALGEWISNGGDITPSDDRRHHITDAVAIPGIRAKSAAWSHDSAALTIGSNDGAEEWVATAQRVLTELNKIVNAFNTHTHPVSGVATLVPTAPLTGVVAPASATVKVRG